MKVIGKRKPFKSNNSNEVLHGLHISNAHTMGRERCDERFGKSCIAIHVIHNCAESSIQSCLAGAGELFLQHYCKEEDHFTPSISIGSITRDY